MNKIIILVVIAVLAFFGWMFYQNSKTTTYAPQTSTPEVSANQEIDNETKNIDEGLNSTNENDFNPSSFSDISQY